MSVFNSILTLTQFKYCLNKILPKYTAKLGLLNYILTHLQHQQNVT